MRWELVVLGLMTLALALGFIDEFIKCRERRQEKKRRQAIITRFATRKPQKRS